MNCPNCNASNDQYARFCENCGALILPGASPAQPAAPTGPSDPASSHAAQEPAGGHDPYAAAEASLPDTPTPSAFPESADRGFGAGQPAAPAYGQGVPAGYATPAASPYATAYAPVAPGGETAPGVAFGLAITSLVIGIVGIMTFGIFGFLGLLGAIFGIVALVLRSGYAKRGLYDRHSGSSLGLGIAGIVLNALSLLIFTIIITLAVMSVSTDPSLYDELAEIESSLSTTEHIEGTHA